MEPNVGAAEEGRMPESEFVPFGAEVSSSAPDAAGAPPPMERPSHGLSTMALGLGALALVGAVAMPVALSPELSAQLASHGVRSGMLAMCGFAGLAFGFVARRQERLMAEVAHARARMMRSIQNSGGSEHQAESVASKLAPAMGSVASVLGVVEKAVERVRSQVEQMGERFHENERANLGLAGSVDGLAAKMDKLQKELRAPGQGPSLAEELTPLSRMMDAMSRDEHARAAKLHEAMNHLRDEMAEMEGRMRQRIDAAREIGNGGMSQIEPKIDNIDVKVGFVEERLGSSGERVQQLASQMSELRSGMEAQLAEMRQAMQQMRESSLSAEKIRELLHEARPRAAMHPAMKFEATGSMMRGASSEPAAALPVQESQPEAPAAEEPIGTIAEGPKQSRTVLRAIDKLRSLRGS